MPPFHVLGYAALIFLLDSASAANDLNCLGASAHLEHWVVVMILIPTTLNLVSLGVMVYTIIYVRRLRDLTESVSSNINWLSRTAVNVSIGRTAKKAIREYALRQPELAKFVHAPAIQE
ncbi:hypothetical protein AAVH_05717 [Aphelenchoides avenae]|nr:hypothetical protein AAVH_05717 [Aphelenchus avenae]